MSIGGIIAALALLTLVVLIIAWPLIRRPSGTEREADAQLSQLERAEAYYERVLQVIRDLDDDHALGKIDDADYTRERELWAQRGVQVLRLIDTLSQSGEADLPADTLTVDDQIEQMVADARSAAGEPAP